MNWLSGFLMEVAKYVLFLFAGLVLFVSFVLLYRSHSVRVFAGRCGWVFRNNNVRWFASLFLTVIFLVLAIISTLALVFGQATPREFHYKYEWWQSASHGLEEPSIFWVAFPWLWAGFFGFFIFTLVYAPIAWREEWRQAIEETKIKIREKRRAEAKLTKAMSGGMPGTATASVPTGFWGWLKRLLPAELAGGAVELFFHKVLGL